MSSTQLFVCVDVDDLEKAVAFPAASAFASRAASVTRRSRCSVRAAHCICSRRRLGHTRFGAMNRFSARTVGTSPVHLDFVTDDLDAAVHKAVSAGATLEGQLATHAWGRIANLSDPFGHGFCLLQMSERGYDALLEP